MRVVITGTSNGIGRAIAQKFLECGHEVFGIDVLPSTVEHSRYVHIQADVVDSELPEIENVNVVINNAGVQNSGRDIDVNLKGSIRTTEKYAFQQSIKSVLFIASASAHNGAEFPEYSASKGGVISYMKNVALRLAKYGATSNSISPGGVLTSLNDRVVNDKEKWQLIMNETLLEKWASAQEIADWAYFVCAVNKSMTAQDILIDNGEMVKANFIW